MNNGITLLTPAHARDYDRFCFQRESIERCGISIPHVVVVNDEDVALFQQTPFRKGLTVIATSQLLSPQIEGRRRAGKLRRRNPLRWWLLRRGGWIHGWLLQQIIKLAAPKVISTPLIVCIDSDTFFVDRVTEADFCMPDGRAHLYETEDDIDAEMAEWPAHSMRFLGLKPTGMKLARYTHSPVVFQREVLLDLQKCIEQRHRRPWDEAIADAELVMEYTTYGVFAREVDQLRRVAPVLPRLSTYFWWTEEVARIAETFTDQVERTRARIVGVQSNTGCTPEQLRVLVEPFWDRHLCELAEAATIGEANVQRDSMTGSLT
ncbi:MAG TPA: DUF6492 family protein [Chthoniobacter sp.]|nr:DUF6492 family protein [Chthoniobacter sp.]